MISRNLYVMGKLHSDGYKIRSIGYSREGPEHTNTELVPTIMSGKA